MTLPELVAGADGAVWANGGDPDQNEFMTMDDVRALEARCREQGLIQ